MSMIQLIILKYTCTGFKEISKDTTKIVKDIIDKENSYLIY